MAQAERDGLQKSIFSERACEEGEDVELSLGLSLNGRFGVDPRAKKLCRSSSIPEFVSPARENGAVFTVPFSSDLMRTSSLPAETDEQWRQRKEIQMLRRLEAKRKRSEKQRIFKKENGSQISNGLFGGDAEGFSPKSTVTAPSSQGSIGSQGSGSSATLESGINPVQGMNKYNTEARSPVSVQSLSECEQKFKLSQSPPAPRAENSRPVKPTVPNGEKEPPVKNILGGDMPCVSTKGDGPNGRRIEGFLYRYRKGEEVRIVCVCHGSFLTPAEFVKHAGGGDVAHPLRHIVVNPFPVL